MEDEREIATTFEEVVASLLRYPGEVARQGGRLSEVTRARELARECLASLPAYECALLVRRATRQRK